MAMNMKELVIALAAAAVVLALAAAAYYYLGNKRNAAVPANTTAGQSVQKEIPPEIQAIMNDNLTGTVAAVSGTSVTLATADGQKTYTLTDKSSVLQQISNQMVNKKTSDIQKGMKLYLQYDPKTNDALTITILP